MNLTAKEKSRLADLSEIVTANLEIFRAYGAKLLETWQALAKIKAMLGKDFGAYCQATWGFGDNYARRLISQGKVAAAVPIGTRPKNEAQARALAKIPPALRSDAMAAVGDDPTAAKIDDLAKRALASIDPAKVIRESKEQAKATAGRQTQNREQSKDAKALGAIRGPIEKAIALVDCAIDRLGRVAGLVDADAVEGELLTMKAAGNAALLAMEGTVAMGKAA